MGEGESMSDTEYIVSVKPVVGDGVLLIQVDWDEAKFLADCLMLARSFVKMSTAGTLLDAGSVDHTLMRFERALRRGLEAKDKESA